MKIQHFFLSELKSWLLSWGAKKYPAAALTELVGSRVVDLFLHVPVNVVDLKPLVFKGCVIGHSNQRLRNARAPHSVHLQNGSDIMRVYFFNWQFKRLQALFPIGQMRAVIGKIKQEEPNSFSMTNPERVLSGEQISALSFLEPVYPLTKGVSFSFLHTCMRRAFDRWDDIEKETGGAGLEEWWPAEWLAKHQWASFKESLRSLHFPKSLEALHKEGAALKRLAADEWLAHICVSRQFNRQKGAAMKAPTIAGVGHLWQERLRKFGLEPTSSQKKVIQEMGDDLAKGTAMSRLLQGDVGSGKTLMAEWLLTVAVEAGGQGVFMVPTDILARQHHETLRSGYPELKIEMLSQSIKKKERSKILQALEKGEVQILVGTHAVFQKDVVFSNLSACVIDEQHRFGVEQRAMLMRKTHGQDWAPHTLFMSATPIPRTLAMAMYGDIDISIISEKPKNRAQIQTTLLSMEGIDSLVQRLREYLKQPNKKAYWVCPLIEESESKSLATVHERASHLTGIFGDKLDVLHGKMPPKEKEAVMSRFLFGQTQLLLSTSVIEVGLHVPEACVMVIEDAQIFGLSQLHQLRGRVGRSEEASFCVLLYQEPLSYHARERLKTMRQCSDGFVLAKKDLILRGSGERFGIRQTGHREFVFFSLDRPDYQQLAHDVAAQDLHTKVSAGTVGMLQNIFTKNFAELAHC